MNRYEIYCTAEQTAKAIELGAPIKWSHDRFEDDAFSPIYVPGVERMYATVPTTTQMIGWLEEQDMIIETSFKGTDEPDKKGNKMYIYHLFDFKKWEELNPLSDLYQSQKEATLAAIDAALDYLTKNKK